MLKILVKSPDTPEPVAHLFAFNSPSDPRGEANAIKDALSNLIAAAKAGDISLPRANGGGPAGGMSMAKAASSRAGINSDAFYDDTYLKGDFDLQQSLLKKDTSLNRTYQEALRTKPETVTITQFNAQFWSTRTNLLRAHAVEKHQKRGEYNVLSVVKPKTEDGELKLRVSKEQISLIFTQHPLVKRVYDENVPKIDEATFWSRFFLSRLNKKLKGERITDADSTDPIFDRYLDAADKNIIDERLLSAHIPHVIDIEGNEENQGGAKSGNRKDFTMRQSSSAKAPIIRTLNSLSEKIMAHVAPSDVNPADPIGMDESTYNELVLRDLQGDPEEQRLLLNIREQSRFFSSDNANVSAEAATYAKQDPTSILRDLENVISPNTMGVDASGGLNLRDAMGFNEDSDSDEEEEQKQPHVGSKSSMMDAQKQVWEGIRSSRTTAGGGDAHLSGLSQTLFDRLALCNATTTEFLHQFWSAFLSGDPDRAGELAKSVESLDRAFDRINAVAADAEKERVAALEHAKAEIRRIYEATGKKRPFRAESIGGGAEAVKNMLEPTIGALKRATEKYREALQAEGVNTEA